MMINKSVIATTALLLGLWLPGSSYAQTLEWAVQFGGPETDELVDMAVNTKGEVFFTCEIPNAVDFDPGPGERIAGEDGKKSVQLVKLDASGQLAWFTTLNSEADHHTMDLKATRDGGVLVSGWFNGSLSCCPGKDDRTLPVSYDSNGGFLIKFDQEGQCAWSLIPQSGTITAVWSVEEAADGSIWAGGNFRGPMEFTGSDALVMGNANPSDLDDAFLLHLDANGTVLRAGEFPARKFPPTPKAMHIDADGNLFVALTSQYMVDFDPGPETYWGDPEGDYLAVVKFDSEANLQWVGGLSGASRMDFNDMALAPDGTLVITGRYKGSLKASGLDQPKIDPSTDWRMFQAKVDQNGAATWLRVSQEPFSALFQEVAVTPDGTIYDFGYTISNTSDLDLGPETYTLDIPKRYIDLLRTTDADGNFIGAHAFETDPSGGFDGWYNLETGPDGALYLAGRFYNKIDVDPSAGQHWLEATGYIDLYVVKLRPTPDNTK